MLVIPDLNTLMELCIYTFYFMVRIIDLFIEHWKTGNIVLFHLKL